MKAKPDTDLVFQIPSSERTYDGFFKQITKLQEGDMIIKQSCKFCVHPVRLEAEQKFEQSHRSNYSLIGKFFKEWEDAHPGEFEKPMNMENVRTHLYNHYLQQEKRIWLRDYSEKLKEMINYKIDQGHRFEMLRASLEIKLHEIAANPTLDVMKQADVLTKITKSICEIELTQHKLRTEIDSEKIILEKVADIWYKTIKMTSNAEVRRLLMDALDSFQAGLDGVRQQTNE